MAAKAVGIQRARGYEPFRGAEMYYSLLGRDLGQALANGGAAAVFAAAFGLAVTPHIRDLWQAAMLGALAAVTADTWATELGVLSRRPPVMITTGKPAVPGRSGAVSTGGTLAAAAGARSYTRLCAAAVVSLPTCTRSAGSSIIAACATATFWMAC